MQRLAAALTAKGLKRGDRIAIRLGNSSHSALMFFAAIAAGFVALPLSDQLTTTELGTLLEDSGRGGHRHGASVARRDRSRKYDRVHCCRRCGDAEAPDAPGLCAVDVQTIRRSSSTRRVRRRDRKASCMLIARHSAGGRCIRAGTALGPDDRMLHAGAFNWTFTLGVGLTDPWANGATAIVCTGDKRPELWPGLIAATGATLFAAVPGVYRQILKYARPEPQALGRLRHGLMAGETPPPGLIEDWTAATGRPLYEALGMSEISTYISTGPSVPHRPGSVGKAQPGRRVAILPVTGGDEPLSTAIRRSDRRASLRPGADARLLAAARRGSASFPWRMVRRRRPRLHR